MSTLANVKWIRPFLVVIIAAMVVYLYFDAVNIASKLEPLYNATLRKSGTSQLQVVEGFDPKEYLNGPPTLRVHDNLRNDTQYITAFADFGFTNEMMNTVNLIYLAILASRVPIVPPHVPMHVGTSDEVHILHFGDVWDLDALRLGTGMPILEWRDAKYIEGLELDILGCWTQWATSSGRRGSPRQSGLYYNLHLDVSFMPIPDSAKLLNSHHSFHAVAALGFPDGRREGLVQGHWAHDDEAPFPSPIKSQVVPPDDHLMCLDVAYYLSGSAAFEWEKDFCPAWRFVGKHLKWNRRVQKAGDAALRKLWNVADGAEIPKYIAIHVRHGDFKHSCQESPMETCLAPLSAIAAYVAEVRQQLMERLPGSDYSHVLLTSDEKDPSFWEEAQARAWSSFDWGKQDWAPDVDAVDNKIHPRWWPTVIDAYAQSMGSGFVGTEGSTMSLVALKRTQDWSDGVGVMVPFGPGMYPTDAQEEEPQDE